MILNFTLLFYYREEFSIGEVAKLELFKMNVSWFNVFKIYLESILISLIVMLCNVNYGL